MMPRKRYGFIFARGGSKGLPGKNVRSLDSLPLIAHAIRAAKECGLLDRIIVSTEDEEIAETAKRYGAEVPFRRPDELASDTAPEWKAWQHAIQNLDAFDTFVSIPAVAPLRIPDDIACCIKRFEQGDSDFVITITKASANPFCTMVMPTNSGHFRLAMSPEEHVFNRQAAPKVFEIVSVAYVTSPSYIMKHKNYWGGSVGAVEIPRERAVDIDTLLDFKFAEFLMAEKNKA
jgi:N-acylneuraminate cytidylyltransferase